MLFTTYQITMKIILLKKKKTFKSWVKKYGIVQPDSFRFDTTTENYFFTLTNFKDTIDVVYKGQIAIEFKEGENLILTAYRPSDEIKDKIIAFSYQTNHSMEVENWEGANQSFRDGLGINNFS